MSRMEFFIVDVFTVGRKYTGNQLAVYLGNPPAALMQQLAKEINFSETTFVTANQPEKGGYNVRIFMPEVEVDFAGHPVLGTAYVIQRELIGHPVEELILNLPVGPIPVTFSDDGLLWMRQNPPKFGHIFTAADLAQILNVEEADIDTRFPLQEVSTGMAFVLAPLISLEAVKRARVNLDRLRAILGPHDAIAPAIFCAETLDAENDIHVRVLDDIYGAPEDPATGSANGCIAGYMVEHGYFGADSIAIRSEQGYQIGRPSLLHLEAERVGKEIDIRVGGRVEMVAQGTMAADE
ncbi:MAG: PhzF family phenazine biosynthesis protein [Chloroflexi bacterium]|nr:PhzF family phenazine biosynthesis protein [Chloroflexota bacterium]